MGIEKTPTLEAVVPILSVNDLDSAIKYYQEVLGFQVGWTWGKLGNAERQGRQVYPESISRYLASMRIMNGSSVLV